MGVGGGGVVVSAIWEKFPNNTVIFFNELIHNYAHHSYFEMYLNCGFQIELKVKAEKRSKLVESDLSLLEGQEAKKLSC